MMIDQSGTSGKPATYRPRHHEVEIYDAAWNAVAVASTHWQQSTAALRYTLERARLHGLSTMELCAASGLDAASVNRMIDEAE